MAEEAFDLRPDEARLLLNVALMATGKNFFKSATKILAALEKFRPEEESVGTAKVVLMISLGEFELAVGYIDREALVKWPNSAMLRAFRGMALIRMGRKEEARDCLVEAAQSEDEAAANLARGLLE